MVCKKCGTELVDGINFCPKCGAVTGSLRRIPQDNFQNENRMPRQKIGKRVFAGIAIAVLVIAAGIVIMNRSVLANMIKQTFYESDKYYQDIEKQTFSDYIDTVNNIYEKSTLVNQSGTSNKKINAKLTLEEGGTALLSAAKPGVDFSWLNGTEMVFNRSKDESNIGVVASLLMGGKNIADINAVSNFATGDMYYSIPVLSPAYIHANYSDMAGGGSFNISNDLTYSDLSEIRSGLKDIKRFMTKYVNVVIDNIENVTLSTDIVTAGDISIECTLLDAKLDMKTLKNICVDFASKAQSDQDIKELINEYDSRMGGNGQLYDSFIANLKTIEQSADYFQANNSNSYVEMKVWVDNEGEIISRDISLMNAGKTITNYLKYSFVRDDSKFGYNFNFNDINGSGNIGVVGSGTMNGDMMTGDFKVSFSKANMNVSVDKFNVDSIKDGNIKGIFTFSLPDAPQLQGYSLRVNVNSNESDDVAVSLLSNNAGLFTLSFNAEESKDAVNLTVPDDVQKYEMNSPDDFSGYEKSIDSTAIMTNLRDAGIPSDMLDQIQQAFDGLKAKETKKSK